MNLRMINLAIESNKLSKLVVANKCGISRTTLDNLLNGADVKVSTIEKLAEVLKVPVGTFFDEHPTANNAIASGEKSIAAINSEVGADSKLLEEKVKLLEQVIQEKERLIQILLKK